MMTTGQFIADSYRRAGSQPARHLQPGQVESLPHTEPIPSMGWAHSFTNLYKTSLLRYAGLSALLVFLLVAANAQQRGSISGKVVTEDGAAMAGVTVYLNMFGSSGSTSRGSSALTDEEGNFRFNNLLPRSYGISVVDARSYVTAPMLFSDGYTPRLYRVGENATVTMVKGGIITGRVTAAAGEPMIGTYVAAIRVRDAEGNKIPSQSTGRPRMTDDRGVYRLYGLSPGTYIVVANNAPQVYNSGQFSPYDGEVPTYYPSATRDIATEIVVTSGSEATGIDIRHRGERGHAVSGKVIGKTESPGTTIYMAQITLTSPATGAQVSSGMARAGESDNGFAMLGIPDGEYEVEAFVGGPTLDQSMRSESRRVTVKGADVSGLELKLGPLGSIAGRVAIEPAANACDAKLKRSTEEIVLLPKRDEKTATNSPPIPRMFLMPSTPDEKGEFKLNALTPSRYRIEPSLPNENWFVKSITGAGASPAGATPKQATAKPANSASDLGRNGITLKLGEKFSGVTVNIADGAASLRGKVAAQEGAKLPSRLRVHLIPADATLADDVLRYAEAQPGKDGAFAFANLAPGKYWLLARAIADTEPSDRPLRPAAWDDAERAKLRKDAEAARNEIELKACQRVKDHVLRF